MKTANIIGFAGSVILVLSLSLWMPFVGPFFSLIMPLPFLFYFSRLGLKDGLSISAVILILVWILGELLGEPYLIPFCLGFGIVGFIISELFRRQFSIGATVLWGTASMLFIGGVFLVLAAMSKNQGPSDVILGYFQSDVSKTVGIYENSGLDQEKIQQIKQALDLLSKLISRVYPALMVIGTGLAVWINVAISKPLFKTGGMNYPSFGDADKWCSPEYLVWGFIGAGFALFLPATGIRFVAENLLLVLLAIYMFQGLSILIFFFNKYGMPRWARIGIYIFIILQQLFLVLLAAVGLFDQWVDFRKLHKKIDSEAV
jgi:uncharacterized protein YybS (DUF2232 family)